MVEGSPTFAAIVLAGGRSRRMGRDKAWLPVGNETFLQRICLQLTSAAQRVIVVAAAGQSLPDLQSTVRVVRDEFPDAGPLAGFLTGLKTLQDGDGSIAEDCIWLASCDAPFCDPQVIDYFRGKLKGHDAVVLKDSGRLHPLGAVYDSGVVPHVSRLFDTGGRSLMALLDRIDVATLNPAELLDVDPNLTSMLSFNTPAELESGQAAIRELLAPQDGVAESEL